MSKQRLDPDEYQTLRAFVDYFSTEFLGAANLPAQDSPLQVLAQLEKSSPAKAERGLLMAVDDCVAMTESWTPQKVSEVDTELRRRKLILISELRRRYSKKFLRVLKQNRIKSEDQYYLVKGVLDDMAVETGAHEREKLLSMIDQYEAERFTGD